MLKFVILMLLGSLSQDFAIGHKFEPPEKSLQVNSSTTTLSFESLNLILYWTKLFNLDDPLTYFAGSDRLSASDIVENGRTFGSLNSSIDWSKFIRLKSCDHQFPRCLVTSTRAYIKQAKYILFFWREYNIEDLPTERIPNQTWILENFESPSHVWDLPENTHPSAWFNLTATYRLDSDIHIPYGQILSRKDAIDPMADPIVKVDLNTKTRLVAWFVSNCNSANHREQYGQQLSKYIDVDIYGECGPLKCSRDNKDACYEMVQEKYFFYLSFENSNCIDYITEKAFNVMRYNIVPVVYGGANYSRFLPAGSYIDANHMKPHDLADLLIDIRKNRTRYLEYFEWKQDYVSEFNRNWLCSYCDRLEEESAQPDTIQTHRAIPNEQINSWFKNVNACDNTPNY